MVPNHIPRQQTPSRCGQSNQKQVGNLANSELKPSQILRACCERRGGETLENVFIHQLCRPPALPQGIQRWNSCSEHFCRYHAHLRCNVCIAYRRNIFLKVRIKTSLSSSQPNPISLCESKADIRISRLDSLNYPIRFLFDFPLRNLQSCVQFYFKGLKSPSIFCGTTSHP